MSIRNSRSAYCTYAHGLLQYEIKAHRGIHKKSMLPHVQEVTPRQAKKAKSDAGHMAKYLHAVDESRSNNFFQTHVFNQIR